MTTLESCILLHIAAHSLPRHVAVDRHQAGVVALLGIGIPRLCGNRRVVEVGGIHQPNLIPQVGNVAGLEQHPAPVARQRLWDAPDVSPQDGRAEALGLDAHQTEDFVPL